MDSARIWKIVAVVGGIVVLYIMIVVGIKMMRGPDPSTNASSNATLEFWNVFDKSGDMRPLLDKFTAQYGTKVNYRSFPDSESYREALLTELATGYGPDVFAVHRSWVGKYRKLLAPLPAADLGISVTKIQGNFVDVVGNDFFLAPLPDPKKPNAKSAAMEVLGLPMYLDTLGLFYNDTVFKHVLAKPSGRPETTWDGVVADVTKITTRDVTNPEQLALSGIALGTGSNIIRAPDIFAALLLQKGVTSILSGGAVKFGAPGAVVLDFLTHFSRNTRYPEYTWNAEVSAGTPEKEVDAFARGQVAMIAGYSYYRERVASLVGQLQRKLTRGTVSPSTIRAAPFPQEVSADGANQKIALADYFALSAGKNSKLTHEAWNLILFLTSKDVQKEYVAATRKPASRRDVLTAQVEDSELSAFAEQAVYAAGFDFGDRDKFALAVRAMLDTVTAGDLTVPQAITLGEKYLTCLLNGAADDNGCQFGQ